MESLPSPFLASVDAELASFEQTSSSSGDQDMADIGLEHPATVEATAEEVAGMVRTPEVRESSTPEVHCVSTPEATASREQPTGFDGNTLLDTTQHGLGFDDDIPLSQPRGGEMGEETAPVAVRSAGLDEGCNAAIESPAKTGTEAKTMRMHKTSAVDTRKNMQSQLDEVDSRPLCVKCRYPVVDVFRARKWGKQKDTQLPTFCCRVCNNAMTQMSKNLNLAELEDAGLSLASLPAAEITAFYAKVYEQHGNNEELSWAALKELLIESLTQSRLSRSRVRMDNEELPLSVWKTRGFDIDQIQQSGTSSPHPVFGEVWSVPLRTKTTEELSLDICN